jgi:DNA-directed RNA polymerase subunit beta'
MDKKGLNNLLAQMYLEFGGAKTAELANSLKNLGYRYATKSGTTISIADLQVPEAKKEMLKDAEKEIEKCSSWFLNILYIYLCLPFLSPNGDINTSPFG